MTFRERCERLHTDELLERLRRGLVADAEIIVREVLAARGLSAATIQQATLDDSAREAALRQQEDRLARHGARLLAFTIDLAVAALMLGAFATLLESASDTGQAAILAAWGYMLFRDAIPGGSLGKRLLKLRVVRVPGEHRMTLGASFFRNLGHAVFVLDAVFILGERRMRLGDMIAGTIVLRRNAPGAGIPPAACPPAP